MAAVGDLRFRQAASPDLPTVSSENGQGQSYEKAMTKRSIFRGKRNHEGRGRNRSTMWCTLNREKERKI